MKKMYKRSRHFRKRVNLLKVIREFHAVFVVSNIALKI